MRGTCLPLTRRDTNTGTRPLSPRVCTEYGAGTEIHAEERGKGSEGEGGRRLVISPARRHCFRERRREARYRYKPDPTAVTAHAHTFM